MLHPALEPTPVADLATSPQTISTTDYQELFFPHSLPKVEDDSIDSNSDNSDSSNNNPYFEFLLNTSIGGSVWDNVEQMHIENDHRLKFLSCTYTRAI